MTPLHDSARGCSAPLVVWDVDRTLTRSDTLVPFLRAVVGPALWAQVVRRTAIETAWHGATRSVLKARLLRQCLAGREYAAVLTLAEDFAETLLAQECRPDAIARWAWHQARGDHQVLASASLELYLEPLATSLGAEHVLATGLQVEDDRLTGGMSTANCRGPEKARRIAALIQDTRPSSVWFYSDSRSDRPSFALADVATTVRPWRRIPVLVPAGERPPLNTPGVTR